MKYIHKRDLPKSMAVMLDLDKTSDDIDLEGASIFVRELETLRKRFGADICYISISTHSGSQNGIKKVLDLIKPFVTKNIVIGKSFFYGGSYDYMTDEITLNGINYNINKINTFKNYYLNSNIFNNIWFAIVDDSLNKEEYLKYKDLVPSLFIKPGTNEVGNFMFITTETIGFDGVLECFDKYIRSTKKINLNAILNEQREIITHLSTGDVILKIKNHEFDFLIKYFEGGYADDYDYKAALNWLRVEKNFIKPKEINKVKILVSIIKNDIQEKNLDNQSLILESELVNK